MTVPTTVFFDVGGVLGTNGWDHLSRKRTAENFKLDWEPFEKRHDTYAEALDDGKISLSDYVEKVAFDEPRQFTKQAFIDFMKNESQADPAAIALAASLAKSKKYLVATINNESPELNDYRIEKFKLKDIFSLFFSSGYLGVRKPGAKIYQMALAVTQKQAQECVFIDDRDANLEQPKALGMHTILFVNADQARKELNTLGIMDV